MFNDKVHNILRELSTRDKILNSDMNIDDCDNQNACESLKSIKQSNHQHGRNTSAQVDELHQEDRKDKTNIEDLTTVIKKAKRRSSSYIFSKRYYSVYKCAVESERMMQILLRFYNVIIKHQCYPGRWLDVLDVMLEKAKVILHMN